ncbi:MAG: hypothetical protein IJ204_09135 [Paludibacteraceae bacterium]|nr:hypothetical protein [Paludibacteraceae bacterium]
MAIVDRLSALLPQIDLHIPLQVRAAKGQPKQGGRGVFRHKRKGKIPLQTLKQHIYKYLAFLFVENWQRKEEFAPIFGAYSPEIALFTLCQKSAVWSSFLVGWYWSTFAQKLLLLCQTIQVIPP